MAARYEIRLAKKDFKFSVAHFTVFGDGQAERLHGHNYRVRVAVSGPRTDELGLLVDLVVVKEKIRSLCSRLDETTLLPRDSRLVGVEERGGRVDVTFDRREYSFPREDVLILPIVNTTIEELARYFWKEIASELDADVIRELQVEVAETHGQSCRYVEALDS